MRKFSQSGNFYQIIFSCQNKNGSEKKRHYRNPKLGCIFPSSNKFSKQRRKECKARTKKNFFILRV